MRANAVATEICGRYGRRDERHPYTEDVLINGEILVKGIDISRTGMYLHTGRSFPVGAPITVFFPKKRFTLNAVVKNNQSGIGMGIKFVSLGEAQRAMIETLMRGAAMNAGRPVEKPVVLFVEDNAGIRRLNKSRLLLEGFSVVEAADGIEAIKFLNFNRADIVVLDLNLGVMDGLKVLTMIRGSQIHRKTPVLVFSAQAETPEMLHKVYSAGADKFLSKMMTTPIKLAETVKALLRRPC